MRKLDIISNLVYSMERKLGWCPNPPTTKVESATDSTKDGGQKFKWWGFVLWWAFALFLSPLAPSFVSFYARLLAGILAMVFFGIVGLANVVHAYQEKENIYYLRIVLSFLMCFAGVSVILGNLLLMLIFFVLVFAIAISIRKYYGSRSDKRGDHPFSGVAGAK